MMIRRMMMGVGLMMFLLVTTGRAEPVTVNGTVAITGSPYRPDAISLKTQNQGELKVELDPTGLELALSNGKDLEVTGDLAEGKLKVKSYKAITVNAAAQDNKELVDALAGQKPAIEPKKTSTPAKKTTVNKKGNAGAKPAVKSAAKPAAKPAATRKAKQP